MTNGTQSLPDVTTLAKTELEAALTKTFDDSWLARAKKEHGKQKTLKFMRRLETAVQTARAKELEEIVSGMRDNEAQLRSAMNDIEEAKKDVENIAGYIGAVTKLVTVFEKALGLVGGLPIP